MTGAGNEAQMRLMVDSVAEAAATNAILKYKIEVAQGDMPASTPLHPVVKWVVGAVAGFGSAALIGLGFWVVSSISEMSVTLARMDERMQSGSVKDSRFEALEQRVSKLEGVKNEIH